MARNGPCPQINYPQSTAQLIPLSHDGYTFQRRPGLGETDEGKPAVERQAMNAGIQGLAADIFKSGLVRLDHALAEEGLAARLILQVHDEVVVEAPREEQERVGAIVLDALTQAATLTVPLEVSLKWGENWAEAKG